MKTVELFESAGGAEPLFAAAPPPSRKLLMRDAKDESASEFTTRRTFTRAL